MYIYIYTYTCIYIYMTCPRIFNGCAWKWGYPPNRMDYRHFPHSMPWIVRVYPIFQAVQNHIAHICMYPTTYMFPWWYMSIIYVYIYSYMLHVNSCIYDPPKPIAMDEIYGLTGYHKKQLVHGWLSPNHMDKCGNNWFWSSAYLHAYIYIYVCMYVCMHACM